MMESHHNYQHHHHSVPFHQLSQQKRHKMRTRLLVTIAINLGITLTEVIMAIWANSMALFSDALHNFSDVLALILSLVGLYLLNKTVENGKTFGYQRVELVVGLINAISLIFIGLLALRPAFSSSIQYARDFATGVSGSNHEVQGLPIFVASVISIIFNGLSVYILQRGEHNSISMRSSVLHLFSDMLTSVAVCLTGVMIYFFDVYWVDSIISLVIAGYIIFSSFQLAKYSIQILLNFNVTGLNIENIRSTLCQEQEVDSVFHVHLWSLSESTVMLEAHIGVAPELTVWELGKLRKKLQDILQQRFDINHTTLEFHASQVDMQECQLVCNK